MTELILNIFIPETETSTLNADQKVFNSPKNSSSVVKVDLDQKSINNVSSSENKNPKNKIIRTKHDKNQNPKKNKIEPNESETVTLKNHHLNKETSTVSSAKMQTTGSNNKVQFGFLKENSSNNIITQINSSNTIYSSEMTFADLGILPELSAHIVKHMKFQKLTKVQAKAIPILLNGKDALIMSETGSGKTLAYALPVVESLQSVLPPVTRSDGPLALVFAPTRELALQSYDLFVGLTHSVIRIVPTCIIGGQKRKSEKARLRKGANIVVSTPGRFADHLDNTACLNLQNVRWLVFDEADRLLDMGFQKQINNILAAVQQQSEYTQQVVLLSATLSPGVEKLVELSLKNPVRIEMQPEKKVSDVIFVEQQTGLRLEKASLPDSLTQYVVHVPSKLRLVALAAFINKHCFQSNEKILVFLSCRDSVIFHHDILKKVKLIDYNPDKYPTVVFQLHGGMSQQERTIVLSNFKKSTSGVVLSTDVAARGLDIPNVHWVLQYDSPGSPVNYIHRVGRTARAGNQGNALLFLTPSESAYINLLKAFDIPITEIDVDTILCEVLDYKYRKLVYSLKIQKAKETAGLMHKVLQTHVNDDEKLKERAEKAYVSFVRAYATYPAALKKVFHVKELHLGHVAKSFALRESPSAISLSFKRKREDESQERTSKELRRNSDRRISLLRKIKTQQLQPKMDLLSEYSSGL